MVLIPYPGCSFPSDILARMTIRAVIFDLGGVLLRTADFTRREKLATRLGMSRSELEEFIFGRESGSRAQRGVISVRQHWDNLKMELDFPPDKFQAVLDEFFAEDVLDLDLLDYIRQLHYSYKTGLLSNAFDDLRQVIAEKWHFEDAFDNILISAEVGLAKPDQRIFRLAVARLGVKPGEAIFVDDMQRNVDGAIAAGLSGIRFQTTRQVRQDIEVLLAAEKG